MNKKQRQCRKHRRCFSLFAVDRLGLLGFLRLRGVGGGADVVVRPIVRLVNARADGADDGLAQAFKRVTEILPGLFPFVT